MDIVLVRHGESEGNAEERMQGRSEYDLTERGREQTRALRDWLVTRGIAFDHHYCSPLRRARETAEILATGTGFPAPRVEPRLAELSAGAIERLTFGEICQKYPDFAGRPVTELGDFSRYGGESYDAVQERARELRAELETAHRAAAERLLLVGHGGFNFQLLKLLICEPVPRVCIVKMANCSATLVRLRERRGTYLGEIAWHVPVELMGAASGEGAGRIFR